MPGAARPVAMALSQLPLGWVKGRTNGRWLEVAVPAAFGLGLLAWVPWRSAYQVDFDEGFELMKGLLVSQGHRLYGDFWNDQPPLHTELLALLFRLFGPSAGVGRVLSVGLAVVLMAALYGLARRGSTRLAGVVAVVLALSGSKCLSLSVAVMLELPAFALGLAAVWAWHRWAEGAGRGWLAGSGVLMGCALQVKFTAGLLLPALAVAWGLKWRADRAGQAGTARCVGWDGLLWLAALGGTFGLVILWCYGPGAWEMFARSHFSADTRTGSAAGLRFRLDQLQDDAGLVILALAGVLLQLKWRRRELWFPVAWLLTALGIHALHRPFWRYYLLHFVLPLAWLGGVGVVEVSRRIWRLFPTSGSRGWGWPVAAWVIWSLVLAGGMSLALEKAAWELRRLRQALPAADEPRVQLLRAHARGVHWIFTEDLLAAFWAGLPIPPELAVIPTKRWWSGQITPAAIRASLERHQPELILLSERRLKDWGLEDFVAQHYQPIAADRGLYRRR